MDMMIEAARSRGQAATDDALRVDVLISGGGLVGQTLALALAGTGLTVGVVDPADPAPRLAEGFDGRASAIASASWRMIEVLGLADSLSAVGNPIRRIMVSDALRPGSIAFADGADQAPLGMMVANRDLRAALADAVARQASVHMLAPVRVVARVEHDTGVTLTLDDGRCVSAPLLVIAEGRRSPTRDALGFRLARWDYGHGATVGAVTHARPHDDVAHEIFYPDGPLAFLPMPDLEDGRHRSAFVWSDRLDRAQAYQRLGDRGMAAALAGRAGDFLGELALIGPRATWPLTYHRTAELVRGRHVLVGDAAHGIHPIAGQGLNLGLRDAATLAEVLVDGARTGMDLGAPSLLARYQRWRGLDNLMVGVATDTLTRLFGIRGRAASAVRRLGMGGVERAPALKSLFMTEARGETGTLPRLLQGQTL